MIDKWSENTVTYNFTLIEEPLKVNLYLLTYFSATTLRTALLEKLLKHDCSGNREDFKISCRLMALLVHQATTSVNFPKTKYFQEDFAFLASIIETIASKAPNLRRLCLGDKLPELRDTDLTAKYRFLWQLIRLRNLQVLDAIALHCDSNSLAFIASNMTLLT
jgi:hypothetical protein